MQITGLYYLPKYNVTKAIQWRKDSHFNKWYLTGTTGHLYAKEWTYIWYVHIIYKN